MPLVFCDSWLTACYGLHFMLWVGVFLKKKNVNFNLKGISNWVGGICDILRPFVKT